jgi:hypothetical protein
MGGYILALAAIAAGGVILLVDVFKGQGLISQVKA